MLSGQFFVKTFLVGGKKNIRYLQGR